MIFRILGWNSTFVISYVIIFTERILLLLLVLAGLVLGVLVHLPAEEEHSSDDSEQDQEAKDVPSSGGADFLFVLTVSACVLRSALALSVRANTSVLASTATVCCNCCGLGLLLNHQVSTLMNCPLSCDEFKHQRA